jgi:hypothetical protein
MTASRYSVDQSLLARRLHARVDGARLLVAADLAAGIEQHGDQRLEMRRRRRPIDQQRLGGAADPGAPHLGVEQDGLGHVELGRPVHVDMADALEMREHRHPRLRLHRATRLLPPRGTMTSMAPSRPASIIPTAARSRVGTSAMAASGRAAARSPSISAA